MLYKSLMLLGATLLLSAGLARYWLVGRVTRTAAVIGLAGLAVLLLVSFVDLRATLLRVIPTADGELLWRYLTSTGHGHAVQARLAFGVALGVLLLLREEGAGQGVAFGAGAIGLLSSFSVISHGAVMGDWWPLVSDLAHFLAAGAWAGGVIALVLAPVWGPGDTESLVPAVRRLSTLGLLAVLVLALTGTVNALLHAGDPDSFLASSYVTALVVKLALVAVTVGLAALNRFRLLPRLLAGGSYGSLRASLRIEAVLLTLVLVATGWLSTTAVPHDMSAPMGGGVNLIDNVEGLLEYLGR